MILSSCTQYFKVKAAFHPKSFKDLTCFQAVFSRDSDSPSSLFSFPLFYFDNFVAFAMSSECWNALCEELALISQVLSKEKQWSWSKIKVSKFATSLLMFHLTQRCTGSDRSNSLAGRLERPWRNVMQLTMKPVKSLDCKCEWLKTATFQVFLLGCKS